MVFAGLIVLRSYGLEKMATTQTKRKAPRLYADLRGRILQGHVAPGSAMPTQRELGKRYAVAEGTVWVAMSRLMHEGLVTRIPGRGTFVAERLPVKHETLDFIRTRDLPGTANPANSLRWIEEFTHAAELKGWSPRWHHIPYAESLRTEELAERFANSKGVIIHYYVPTHFPWLLSQRRVPVVTAFSIPGGLGEKAECFPQVSYDRRETAKLATEHLVSLGYSRIAFIGFTLSPMRTLGFLDVLSRNKLVVCPEWLLNLEVNIYQPGDPADQLCHKLCEQVLKAKDRPEAFCCASLRMAHTAKDVAGKLGLKVPEDLAIIACDEAEPSISWSEVDITTVSISREESCRKIVEILEEVRLSKKPQGKLEKNKNSPLYDPIMMPLHLTIRDSCGAKLRGAD